MKMKLSDLQKRKIRSYVRRKCQILRQMCILPSETAIEAACALTNEIQVDNWAHDLIVNNSFF